MQKSKNLSLKRIRITNLNIFNNGISSFKTEKEIPLQKPADAGFFSTQKHVSLNNEKALINQELKTAFISSDENNFFEFPEVKHFFENLGLPADKTSLHLVQFFQQLEVKPDIPKLIKCYNLSKKFPKKEGKAAEIAYLLEEKGINADEEKIQNILSVLDSSSKKNNDNKDSKENDFLKLVNHKTGKNKYWIMFPYELKLEKEKADGLIRLLCDRNKKNTEKIIISANFSRIKFNFVLYYKYSREGNKSLTINFCSKPELSLLKKRNSISILQELFDQTPGTIINYCKYDEEKTEFFSADTKISIIQES